MKRIKIEPDDLRDTDFLWSLCEAAMNRADQVQGSYRRTYLRLLDAVDHLHARETRSEAFLRKEGLLGKDE